MTDQRQSTRDPWTPPARTLEQTPDWSAPEPSTQDSTARDSTDPDRPVDDGTVYESAAHDSAVDEHDVHEPVADGTADERGLDQGTTGYPAGDGESLDAVDRSVPAGRADLDHVDPEHAVGVASVPQADTVDRAFDFPRVAETPTVPAPVDDAAWPDVTNSGEMLPGDVPEEPGLALFDGETTQRFRDRWQELQLRFVDDPHFAEGQAVALVDEVVTALRDAVDRQRDALHDWQSSQGGNSDSGDTEQMRVAVRRYRDFLDHLLGV